MLLSKPKRMIVDIVAYKAARIIGWNHIVTPLCQRLSNIIYRKTSLIKKQVNKQMLSLRSNMVANLQLIGKETDNKDIKIIDGELNYHHLLSSYEN